MTAYLKFFWSYYVYPIWMPYTYSIIIVMKIDFTQIGNYGIYDWICENMQVQGRF